MTRSARSCVAIATVSLFLAGPGCKARSDRPALESGSDLGSSKPAAMPPEHARAAGEHAGSGADHFEHRFEKAADWAPQFDDPGRDEWQKPDHVVARLGIGKGMVVADLGAGTGYFLGHFSRAVGDTGKVIGLDIEPDMVEHMGARAKAEGLSNATARTVAADDPGFEGASIDRIVIVNTWHHIGSRKLYVEKLRLALRPGGHVAIIDYTKDAPRGPPAAHRLSESAVAAELEAGGLRAETLAEDLPYQYIVIGRLP